MDLNKEYRELRVPSRTIIEISVDTIAWEAYLMSELEKAGFDIFKTISLHYDWDTNEHVYTQEI